MVFTPHRTIKIGFEYEVTEGTDPGGSSPFEFGLKTFTIGNLPKKEFKINSYYSGGREPSLYVAGADPRAPLAFAALNALPFYWFGATVLDRFLIGATAGTFQAAETVTGGSSGATAVIGGALQTSGGESTILITSYSAGTFTIGETLTGGTSSATGVLTGFKHEMTFNTAKEHQNLSTRFQSDGSGDTIRKVLTGGKVKNISFSVDDANKMVRSPCIYGIGILGLDLGTPGQSGDLTYQKPGGMDDFIFNDPDDSYFKWDYNGDNVEYIQDLTSFKYIGDSSSRLIPLIDQILPKLVTSGEKTHIFQVEILRGSDTSIYDDYLAQAAGASTTDFKYKVLATQDDTSISARYIEIFGNNAIIFDMDLNDPDEAKGDKASYVAAIAAETLIVHATDLLQGSIWYGVS